MQNITWSFPLSDNREKISVIPYIDFWDKKKHAVSKNVNQLVYPPWQVFFIPKKKW